MSKSNRTLVLFTFLFVSIFTYGQTLKEYKSQAIDIDRLPEFVVIASQSQGRILSPTNLFINSNKSDDKPALDQLGDILTERKKLNIRNHTDLFNAMAAFGFEYTDHFAIGSGFMVNLVFRKKAEYRKSESLNSN